MNQDILFTFKDKLTLKKARETYGAHKQIGVAAEECTELAKELIKAFRYDDFNDAVKNTKDNVVDEVADVFIVLDHVLELYDIRPKDLIPHVTRKMNRLRYWLENSDSIEFTTQHRKAPHNMADSGYIPERDEVPYDPFDYGSEQIDISQLEKTGEGVFENEFLRLFYVNDKKYREG